jgi:ABC-type lipoprotein release transport system permease subunit
VSLDSPGMPRGRLPGGLTLRALVPNAITAGALCVGLTASLIPALRGSRVEPVDVLRGQLG